MEILSYVIYGSGVLLTLVWLVGARVNINSGEGVAASTVNITFLFIVALILIPTLDVSPFHLIWLFCVATVIGMLSATFSYSKSILILSIPGYFLWRLVCIGIDTSNMTKKIIYGLDLRKLQEKHQ